MLCLLHQSLCLQEVRAFELALDVSFGFVLSFYCKYGIYKTIGFIFFYKKLKYINYKQAEYQHINSAMGIKNLNRFFKEECKGSIQVTNLAQLSGKKIAIDISIYMYKYSADDSLIENLYLMLSVFSIQKMQTP